MNMNKKVENKNLHPVNDEELSQVVGGSYSVSAFRICPNYKNKKECNAVDICVWEWDQCVPYDEDDPSLE